MSLLSLFNQLYASLINKSISFLKNVTDPNVLNSSLGVFIYNYMYLFI